MKKLISILLTTAMITSITAYAVDYGEELKNMPKHTYEQRFSDVPTTHWAFDYIGELVNDNVINGYPDGKFRPENNVSRAEFAKIMITAAGIKTTSAAASSFSDVDVNEWYCPYIESAKEFLTGYQYSGGAMYLPDKMAIREDIAVALVKLKGYDISVADLSMLKSMFSDYDSISETAKRYVAVAVERGLVSGYDNGTFKGQQSITRAEAAALIWRANQYGSDNKILGNEATPQASKSPSATANPTNEQTVRPTATPTAELTAKPETKPYVMKKLASANVDKLDLMTMDNSNNIYYVDGKTIYKLNTSTGSKKEFMDLSDLTLQKTEKQDVEVEDEVTETVETGEFKEVEETVDEEVTETVVDEETGEEKTITKTIPKTVIKKVPITKEETKTVTKTVTKDVVVEEYSNFVTNSLKYDMGINKLFITGYFKSLQEPYKSKQHVEHYVLYDITDGTEKLVAETKNKTWYGIALDSERLRLYFDGCEYELNTSSNTLKNVASYSASWNLWIKHGNNLYRNCCNFNNFNYVEKYNFSDGEYETLSGIYGECVGISKTAFYFYNNDKFTKVSVIDRQTEELKINTTDTDVEFADMGGLGNFKELMFIIDDNTIIFYDDNMKAFRILEKNK